MAAIEVERVLNLVPKLLQIPHRRIWTSYDEEADVLYVNFRKPSHADDSELTHDDIIIRHEKGRLWGSPCSTRTRGNQDKADLLRQGWGNTGGISTDHLQ